MLRNVYSLCALRSQLFSSVISNWCRLSCAMETWALVHLKLVIIDQAHWHIVVLDSNLHSLDRDSLEFSLYNLFVAADTKSLLNITLVARALGERMIFGS